MSTQIRLIQPLDILLLRGNKSFGDTGEHGASSMPPSPSVLAGALRSFWLAELQSTPPQVGKKQFRIEEYAPRNKPFPKPEAFEEPVRSQLGTPTEPRGFRLAHSGLAHRVNGHVERVFPIPTDLVIQKDTKDAKDPTIYELTPTRMPEGLLSQLAEGQQVPMLQAPAGKPETQYWLDEAGYHLYLNGKSKEIGIKNLVKVSELWKKDYRLGIALDGDKRTAADGQLYTTEAIALCEGVQLVAEIQGAPDFPAKGNLRLGGDGRGAGFKADTLKPLPSIQAKKGKVKLVLTSPAIFTNGWKLPSQDEQGRIQFAGGSARVATASVPRHQVVSGWNLAEWKPKPAERVVPMSSVYWLEDVQCDADTSLQDVLQELLLSDIDPQRRAEGYNACVLAVWSSD